MENIVSVIAPVSCCKGNKQTFFSHASYFQSFWKWNGAGVPFGCYQTLGNLWLDFGKRSGYENYHRELNLDRGVVGILYYLQDGINYKREIFASYPDRALVIRLYADKKGALSFKSSLYLQKHPDFRGTDPVVSSLEQLKTASAKPFAKLLKSHTADYSSLFGKVSLTLTSDGIENVVLKPGETCSFYAG